MSFDKGRPDISLPREIALVVIVSFAQLLTQAGLGQVIAPLHIIGPDLHATNPGVLSWFAAGYSLTVGTFILISGRAGDLFGHKKLFISGFLWYSLWSIIVGLTHFTHSNIFFIISRTLQGIGPAIVLPNGLAILGKTYPASARKNAVFSFFGATAPTGFIMGALFSGIFAVKVNWDWAFYVTGIVCFVIASAASFVIPRQSTPKHEDDSSTTKHPVHILERLDFFASVIGVTGMVLFNIAWNEAPIVGWQQAYIIVLLILGLLLTTVFLYLEFNVSKYPLVPRDIFNRETALILGCISAGWASFGIWVYYLWLFLELQRGHSPLLVSAEFVPVGLAGLAAASVVGLFITRVGPGVIMMGAMLSFTIGNIFCSICPVDQSYWALSFVAIIVMPFGMDMSFPAASLVISDFVPETKQGNAASLVNTILNYSVSIGLGIAGTVEVQLNRGGTNQANLLRGYRSAWRVGIGLASLGIFMSVLLTIFVSQSKARRRNRRRESSESEIVALS